MTTKPARNETVACARCETCGTDVEVECGLVYPSSFAKKGKMTCACKECAAREDGFFKCSKCDRLIKNEPGNYNIIDNEYVCKKCEMESG